MKKENRSLIKKRCRECNEMIRKLIMFTTTDIEQVELIINSTMTEFFPTATKTVFKNEFRKDIIKEKKCFRVESYICHSDLRSSNTSIFINFEKPYKRYETLRREPHVRDGKVGVFVKRLSFANFIFKHCNPFGLMLLEKIMFEIS